jgi:hemerythrin superfamily protein
MNALQLLKADHAGVKKLFRDFSRTTARAVKTRRRLVDQIVTELDVHARIEEEIFYPAVDRLDGLHELVEESREEHAEVKKLAAEVQGLGPDDRELRGKMRELQKAVLHHASEEEEGKMFPQVREAMSPGELARLGSEMAERKRALLEGIIPRLTRVIKKTIRKAA